MVMKLVVVLGLCLVFRTDAYRYWKSRNPSASDMWRGFPYVWDIDYSTYIGGDSATIVKNPNGNNQNVHDLFMSKDSFSFNQPYSGLEFYASPVSPKECLTLNFNVWFQGGFDFGDGGKLSGLYGGGVNCTAGTEPGKECFTTNFVWRNGGTLGVSVFAPTTTQPASLCDDPDVECNQEWGHTLGLDSFTLLPGTWYTIYQSVRLNTPGLADGYIRLWIRNVGVVYEVNNVILRNSASLTIEGIMFATYFSGNSVCGASPQDQHIYMRNFQLRDNAC